MCACRRVLVALTLPAAPLPAQEAPAGDAIPSVTVAPVIREEIALQIPMSGTLVAREEALVFPRLTGQDITAIEAEAGDHVEAGEVLARLEDGTLTAQVAQAEANLAAARAGVAQAEAQQASAAAQAQQAELALERTQSLSKSGDIAQATLDQAQATADQARAAVAAAEAAAEAARAAVTQNEASLRIARVNLDWATIRAPVAGRVLERNARLGALAGGTVPLFRIAAGDEIELEAEVVETDLAAMSEGDPARVVVAGLEERSGTVRLIPPEIDAASRLGRVRIALGNDTDLRVGGFASAIVTVNRHLALTVPASAVLGRSEGDVVQAVVDGVVESRDVTAGLLSGGRREIDAGLAEGETVVTRAGAFLRDGDRVNPVMAEAAAAAAGRRAAPAAAAGAGRGRAGGHGRGRAMNMSTWAIRNPVPPIAPSWC